MTVCVRRVVVSLVHGVSVVVVVSRHLSVVLRVCGTSGHRSLDAAVLNSDFRNKLKFFEKLRKHHNTNPKRGPFHFRAPSRILYHTIRGMIPHKSFRGKQALARLKVRCCNTAAIVSRCC